MDALDLREVVIEARRQLEEIRDAVTVRLANAEERPFDEQELLEEQRVYGHRYDEDCQSPTCTKNRRLFQSALQQAMMMSNVQGGV